MPRIVSLIASATEIVHALGLGEFQVGRSHECDYPESVASLPVCTRPAFPIDGDSEEIDRQVKDKLKAAASIYEVFGDVLERLQPTHIVTQTQCEVCAVSLRDVEKALCGGVSSGPALIALEPNALADIWADILRVATGCGYGERGEALVAQLQWRMEAIARQAFSAASRPTVACIEWHEPLMAAGNWVPELIAMAGGVNLFGAAGRHSPWMRWEELAAADPEIVVTTPCGFDIGRTRAEMHWLTARPGWNELRAVREGRVYLADGNQYMNRPGPRVVESLRIFAEILHPERFEATLEGPGWQRWGG